MHWNHRSYSGWGRVLRVEADVARPERHGRIADIVAGTDRILGIGALRSYGDAALAAGGFALETSRLDRFLSFDAETGLLEAEAGVRLGEILRLFAPRGWMPAVLPGTGMTTLAGAIANDVHGKNHHVAGSFGHHVEAFSLVTADGKTHRVNPKREPGLFQATLGGVGQTGLITAARIRLAPCPATTMAVREDRMDDLSDFIDRFESETAPFQVGWIDTTKTGKWLGRGIFEAADFAPPGGRAKKPPKAKSLPFRPPGFALAAPIVRAFNAAYFARVPAAGRTVERPLQAFFFPLDKIDNWNIAYGKKGFHQFQAVLPLDNAQENLTALLNTVAKGGLVSPLAVIKRMGPGRAGYMSFPMEGYTLALDIPNRRNATDILSRLEAITLDAGGRVYLAKDSTASAQGIADMYPDLDKFREVVHRVDPDGKFASAMARRLDLRDGP